MKRTMTLLISALLVMFLLFPANTSAKTPDIPGAALGFSAEEILIKFKPGTGPADIAETHRQLGGRVKKNIPEIGVQVVTIPAGKAIEKAKAYAANGKVLFAEPNYLAQAVIYPDDPWFSYQWGLQKIEAPAAWDLTQGSDTIKIAILDTGVDINHPDLSNKIVANQNFTTSTTANDVFGHGTHVAGIAAADTDNSIGVSGVGSTSSIINVKVLGDNGSGYYSWVAQGIIWAADNGASIINMSLGGASASSTLESAINYAWSKGLVVVAAAGNSGSSLPSYPAYYSKVIAVAATDSNDKLTSWSNYGNWVDVAAPGSSIYSTLKNNSYGYKSGTSMATPFVSGLASLVFTVVSDTNGNKMLNDEVRAQIEANCDYIGISGIGSGRINAYKSVSNLSSPAPVPLTGTINGMVTDISDGLPINAATVRAGTRSASTNANGEYNITGVPQGSYSVTASAAGYSNALQMVHVVADQTTMAYYSLTKTETAPPSPPKPMWVDNILFKVTGNILRFDIKVDDENGAVAGAHVKVELVRDGNQLWDLSRTTDSSGVAYFRVEKAPAGNYVATVTGLSANGYEWDKTSGVISASYTLGTDSKPGKKR